VNSVSELNKLKARLFVEAVLNEGRLELIDELVAIDYIGHISCAETAVTGPDGVRQLVSSRRRAHPSLYIKIEDQIAEDDRVVTRWHATTTTPQARAVGAPVGRTPCCAGISIIRFLAGKQVDSRTECTNFTSPRGRARDCAGSRSIAGH
jgi:predicted ester cyclase